ncbi:Protein cms1 [Ceratocystis lukuohia]|uniref:Protein cms1 n=1 Tax=Ceratocystis lukuohia TaxID=2019550 RepID=A0ABR4MRT3_9PEZI
MSKPSTNNKRPLEADDASRSKRRRRGNKAREEENDLLNMELKINHLFKNLDSQLTADHYLRQLTRFGADLSPIELADLTISTNAIKDTSSWTQDRVTEKLPEFLENFTDNPEMLSRADKAKGTPHTIVVSGAGLRSTDIVRALRKFQSKNCTIAKLFAKHMKVAEQVEFLGKHQTGLCVGTPSRFLDLIENGALKLEKLERVVVDASYIDQKKRGVMDMKDTMMPLAKFLTCKELQDRYLDNERPVGLIFY